MACMCLVMTAHGLYVFGGDCMFMACMCLVVTACVVSRSASQLLTGDLKTCLNLCKKNCVSVTRPEVTLCC